MQQICHIDYAMVMMTLAAQKPAHLTVDPGMKTGRLREFHAQVGAGAVSLATYDGKIRYGKALLNEALYHMKSPQFTAAIHTVAGVE